MKKKVVIGLVILILAGGAGFGVYGYQTYKKGIETPAGSGDSKIFSIGEGETAEQVGERLESDGLIKSGFIFSIYLKQEKLSDKLQVGDYLLAPSMTPVQIADIIATGKVALLKVTIPEGKWLTEMGEILESKAVVTKEEFKAALKEDWSSFEFIKAKPATVDLEGYLFPDTYTFPYGVKPSEVVRLMLKNMQDKITADEITQGIAKSGFTIHQVLTFASIVEAEARFAEDRPKIAEVFRNRLKRGMKLQSDPTAGYPQGKRKVLISDLSFNSPYNTYIVTGLPIGPIGAPGLDSIKATLSQEPAFGDGKVYLFFCSPPDGKVYYATNEAGHEANKTNFCLKR